MAISEDSAKIVPPVNINDVAGAARGAINPAALTIEQLARAVGMPADTIRRHVEDGVPTGVDGRVNLIHYAAWLNQALLRYALASQDSDANLSRRSREAKPDGD